MTKYEATCPETIVPMVFGPKSPNNGMVFSIEGDTMRMLMIPPGTKETDPLTLVGECNVLHAMTVANEILKAIVPHLPARAYTTDDLEIAISEVLGDDVNGLMRKEGINLPRRHQMACQTAFEQNRNDMSTTILREMMLILNRDGFYPKRK